MMTNPIVFWRDWWSTLSAVERAVVGALFVAAIIIILVTPAGAQGVLEPSNNAVLIALIAATPLLLTSPIIAWMNELSRRRDREEDRRDRAAVAKEAEDRAARANESAKLVVANTASTAKSAIDTNMKLTAVAKTTSVIHTLVNSQLTASKQAEFDSITRELALLREIEGIGPATIRITEAIAKAEAALAELQAVLADRRLSAVDVEKQQRDQSKI